MNITERIIKYGYRVPSSLTDDNKKAYLKMIMELEEKARPGNVYWNKLISLTGAEPDFSAEDHGNYKIN